MAEWLYHIYGMINHTFSVEKYRIFFGACAVAVLLWSYGYNSEDKPRAIRKWLFILSYILSAWAVYTAVTFTVRAFA